MNTIGSSGFLPPLQNLRAQAPVPKPAPAEAPGFADRLGAAIQNLNDSQSGADAAARAYELGERQDLAGVMVEQQVASLGFQLALNVRNRALTAYRDIMNMSV